MIWTFPSRRRRTKARPRHAMMAGHSALIIGRLECVSQNTNLSFEFARACWRGPRRAFPIRFPQRDRRDHENYAVRPIASPRDLRSRRRVPWRRRAGRAGILCSGSGAERLALPDSGRDSILAASAARLGGRRSRASDDQARARSSREQQAGRDGAARHARQGQRQGRKGRPGAAPGGQGAAVPYDRTAKAFPSGSTATTSACRGTNLWARSRRSCWPSSRTIATCATGSTTSGTSSKSCASRSCICRRTWNARKRLDCATS